VHARANGVSLHYEITGPANAPVVVFIHGLAASLEVWKGQAERLGDRFRVLRYDLRSHGGSEAIDRPCTRSDLASDLVALLDAVGVERAALVGHSAGGVIAMQTAVEHPERVAALVLVGTASECNDKTAAWYERSAETARREGGDAARKVMGLRSDAGPSPDGPGCAQVTLAMRTLNREPLTQSLRRVTVPALILVGEKDFLGAGGSVILSRTIEGSELEIVAGRGHGVYLEDPDWFAERLAGFLDRAFRA
jgi:pimeloyl-ACP methyl ester carboxylesterase